MELNIEGKHPAFFDNVVLKAENIMLQNPTPVTERTQQFIGNEDGAEFRHSDACSSECDTYKNGGHFVN